VRDLSRTILNSIHDNSYYVEEDIKNVYRHDHAILKVAPLLRHIYQEHGYDMVSHQSRVLHEL
jgi:tagatose-1,6-bisphosphate aldolase non-catalytic subunit AgaZ/GatZ